MRRFYSLAEGIVIFTLVILSTVESISEYMCWTTLGCLCLTAVLRIVINRFNLYSFLWMLLELAVAAFLFSPVKIVSQIVLAVWFFQQIFFSIIANIARSKKYK